MGLQDYQIQVLKTPYGIDEKELQAYAVKFAIPQMGEALIADPITLLKGKIALAVDQLGRSKEKVQSDLLHVQVLVYCVKGRLLEYCKLVIEKKKTQREFINKEIKRYLETKGGLSKLDINWKDGIPSHQKLRSCGQTVERFVDGTLSNLD